MLSFTVRLDAARLQARIKRNKEQRGGDESQEEEQETLSGKLSADAARFLQEEKVKLYTPPRLVSGLQPAINM